MNNNIFKSPLAIQVKGDDRIYFDVHPLIAKLARTVHPDFGRSEITSMSVPPKLEEYFPEIAKFFGISRKTDMPETKKALGEALEYANHLKPGSSDSIMMAVVRAIKQHL